MRTVRGRAPSSLLLPVLVLLVLAVGTPTRAVADPWSQPPPPPEAHVEVGVENDGNGPVTSGGGGCPSSPTKTCTNDLGMSWVPSRACWATNDITQSSWGMVMKTTGYLDPGGEGWDAAGGAGKTTGSIYVCHSPDCSSASIPCVVVDTFWSSGGVVSAGEVAERAVAAMDLRAPVIGMTGGDGPDSMMIVGVPAWMWAADPGESTTGPVSRVEVDGSIRVEATGVLDKTVWEMGDGVSVTCSGASAAGTPFEARYGGQSSPTCGYTYQRTSAGKPGNAFTVTVTAYWTVAWSGGGESGTIPVQVSRSIQKKVGEVQAVLVPNPGARS